MTARGDLITAEDAAKVVGVEPATLRDWTRRGILPRYGSPRNALYSWADLIAAKDMPKPRRADQRRCS